MEAPTAACSSSPPINPARRTKRTVFFCARCNRYFSNLQSYSRHRNIHARANMAEVARYRATVSCIQNLIRSLRSGYAPILQHRHLQPSLQTGLFYIQTMNGLASGGGQIADFNRNFDGLRYPRPNLSLALLSDEANFNTGACGTIVHVVARNLIPCPSPAMAEPLSSANHENGSMMGRPFLSKATARRSWRAASIDRSSGTGPKNEHENQDLDLSLHL